MYRRYNISKSAVGHPSQSVSIRKWEATSHFTHTAAINMRLFTLVRLSLRSASKPQTEQPVAAGNLLYYNKSKKVSLKERNICTLSAYLLKTLLIFYHQIFIIGNTRLKKFQTWSNFEIWSRPSGKAPNYSWVWNTKWQTALSLSHLQYINWHKLRSVCRTCSTSSDLECAQSVAPAAHQVT